jgi:hypothetical protein
MGSNKSEQDYFLKSALREISLLRKNFGIEGKGDEVRVVKVVSPNNVIDFYREYLASVRPKNLGAEKTLPRSDNNKFRGLYLGQPDVNILLNLIVRHCLYVDQIVLVDPLMSPLSFGVLDKPEGWMEVLINRALCLCALEEWVRKNIVLIIPDPLYYRPDVHKVITENAPKYLLSISKDNHKDWRTIIVRTLVNEREEYRESILDILENMGETFAREERDDLLIEAKRFEEKYPIRFRLSHEFYEKHFKETSARGQVIDFSLGMSLVAAPYVAEIIGAFLLFEHRHHYDEINHSLQKLQKSGNSRLQKIAVAFQQLDFPFLHDVKLKQALKLREKGYLSRFRVYLKDLWDLSSGKLNDSDFDSQTQEFVDRLTSEYSTLQHEWEFIKTDLRSKAIKSGLIVGLTAGSTLVLGNINMPLSTLSGLGAGVLKEYFFSGYSDTAEKVAQTSNQPLFVFLALEKK